MKNIHVLSTEKPSRLYLFEKILKLGGLTTVVFKNSGAVNQHIYITSDEEIKEGDWLIVNDEDVMQMKSSYDNDMSGEDIWVGDSLNGYATYKDNCKKIILTTDQDLIKDGVQAIDDEFLEWFVKNPSCESVKVEHERVLWENGEITHYKYIIIIPEEEPKQETLEEAAEKMYSEEEVLEILKNYRNNFELYRNLQVLPNMFNEWFEQFKKK